MREGWGGGCFGRKLARSVPFLLCLCLPQETATSNVALPAWLGWTRLKSIWVWSKHICLVATNTSRCWEAAAGPTMCQLRRFNTACVISLSTAVQQVLFPRPPHPNPSSPGKYPSAQLCLMKSDVHVTLCIRQITGSDYAPRDPVQSDLCFSQLKLSQKTAMRFSLKNRELYYYYY